MVVGGDGHEISSEFAREMFRSNGPKATKVSQRSIAPDLEERF